MAPTPQEVVTDTPKQDVSKALSGDEVVISGMSGIFPKSDSVSEFMNNLYNKVDMVGSSDARWIFGHPEVPKFLGKVDGMGKFDAQFFRVHYKQGCTMEPMSRKLLEHAYSAIFDSGINPLQLRGKKVGVFIGSTFSESEKIVIYENIQRNGFGITGCNKAMYANRISYWIDGKGPSYALDVACASSMACIEHAYRSISTGQCEAAIVGGCNLCMHPNISLNMKRQGFLCLDGKSKCFDKNGDGYVRSDAISVLFLQKAKDAKRIYSEVYYAKANYQIHEGDQFLSIRRPKEIEDFLEAFYSDIDVSPQEVEYIEGHGSANAEAEYNELQAIGKVFAKNRTVKIGSVVSNMGHSEPASGVCALTKVCLAYHTGVMPGNLHFKEPFDNIPEVKDGRIQVVQENTPFNRGFVALNTFSYSGVNIHVLLKGHFKRKDTERYKSSIPHVVLASGRQQECVKKILNILKEHPVDPETIGLLHNIYQHEIPGHMCRGYIILNTNEQKETVTMAENVDYFEGTGRPLWFVYSGMGSQWATMGAGLMKFPIFAAAIQKCHRVLEPRGINIMHILLNPDKTIYDNILHSFVGIAAVQIGLTDILKAIGIVPDNIIGHSVGELGCAYADGCFSAEEMILSAYSRGLVSVQTPFIKGSMAAVGLGFKAVLPLCPPEIEVACHNSDESSTISGPADAMKEFVGELTKKGIFAKEVPCSNIAYHSRYIAGAGPTLLKYLGEVIKEPKERSAKWVSTSVPEEEWAEPKAKYSSAEYHTNNLLNSVLFEETAKMIPNNAILVEIAPHGLLQAILKRSHNECTHIPLTRRGNSDPVKYLLEAIGKLYIAGLNPRIDVLYPQIEFPVSTETPLLSHFVGWEHTESWPQAKFNSKTRMVGTNRTFGMSIHDDDFKYYEGHVRNGKICFPEAAIIVLVWETFAMHKEVDYRKMPVTFKNIVFYGDISIHSEKALNFNVVIYKGSNRFEVSCDDMKIANGIIKDSKSSEIDFRNLEQPMEENFKIKLTKEDIYKLMSLRGYGYKDEFQTIQSSNVNRTSGTIKWIDDWVTYLDGVLQFAAFSRDNEGLLIPKLINNLIIDPLNHVKVTAVEGSEHRAQIFKYHGITRCGGVLLDKVDYDETPVPEQVADILDTKSFIPHFLSGIVNLSSAIQINLEVVADNIAADTVKITEMLPKPFAEVSEVFKRIIEKVACIDVDLKKIEPETMEFSSLIAHTDDLMKSNLYIVDSLLADDTKMQILHGVIPKDSFVMSLERTTSKIHSKYKLFNVVTVMNVQNQLLILLKRANMGQDENVTFIPITYDKRFSWVARVQSELQKTRRVILVSEKQPYCGLIGLVKKLKNEYGNKIGLLVVDDHNAPSFDIQNKMYKEQLEKNLIFNVFTKGQWGGYYYLTSEKLMNFTNATLKSIIRGDLDKLTWVEAPQPKASSNVVQVHYAGVSSKDVSYAIGQDITDGAGFGMDFSGINSKGQKVMGLLPSGALSSTVEADSDLLWLVPEYWTLEEAATVPMPFVHAFYCLAIKGSILPSHRVFVNGGAGALGQAVISVCLSIGCTVYTAVSDIKKKKFLLKLFPDLKENHIGNSRDGTFYEMIAVATKGRGCDFVINTATGYSRVAAMKCSSPMALFLDVANYDMKTNQDFTMFFLNGERNYLAVNMASIFNSEYANERKRLHLMISEGIRKGLVRPLSRVVYSPNDVTRAFRLLSSSKHRGRVLIRLRDAELGNQGLGIVPRMEYSSNGTHVVVCDKNELGIELIDHLVRRGARKFLVQCEPSTLGGYFYTKSLLWTKLGVTLCTFTEDIQTENGCMKLLSRAAELGPIHGIFVVQRDDNDEESFEPAEIAKKYSESVMVVANLDLMSRNVCKQLQHFVLITNSSKKVTDEYNIAVSEKICQIRNDVGLPALVYHVGKLEEFNKNSNDSESSPQLSYSALFSALETSLKLNYKNVQAFNLRKRPDDEFVRKIEKILGVNNINVISESLTVTDLSLNEVCKQELMKTIKDTFNVSYTAEAINDLTIGSIKNLSDINQQKTAFDSGLGAFFNYIDKEEWRATDPMIAMPTRLNIAIEREEELDPKTECLMLIPGFEGHHRVFSALSARLKLQAITLQLGPDLEHDTIPQMAAKLLKFLKSRFEFGSKFYLLGYSFGVNVALELATLLEKEGHVGTVFCLDSSPDSLRVQLDAYVGDLPKPQLQNAIIAHLYRLMTGKDNEELKKELEMIEDWSMKKEACIRHLRGLVNYSNQYKRSLLESAYRRILMAQEYDLPHKLESEIVLIKGIPHPKAKKLPDDYNLSKYTKQRVHIYNIESDHALAPNDTRTTNIVNKMLDPQVIEEFKKKNLCEVYFADPHKNF